MLLWRMERLQKWRIIFSFVLTPSSNLHQVATICLCVLLEHPTYLSSTQMILVDKFRSWNHDQVLSVQHDVQCTYTCKCYNRSVEAHLYSVILVLYFILIIYCLQFMPSSFLFHGIRARRLLSYLLLLSNSCMITKTSDYQHSKLLRIKFMHENMVQLYRQAQQPREHLFERNYANGTKKLQILVDYSSKYP